MNGTDRYGTSYSGCDGFHQCDNWDCPDNFLYVKRIGDNCENSQEN